MYPSDGLIGSRRTPRIRTFSFSWAYLPLQPQLTRDSTLTWRRQQLCSKSFLATLDIRVSLVVSCFGKPPNLQEIPRLMVSRLPITLRQHLTNCLASRLLQPPPLPQQLPLPPPPHQQPLLLPPLPLFQQQPLPLPLPRPPRLQ